MKLAYLTNRYPAASHSFIRREILALEELGFDILRVSIRPAGADVVDPADRLEVERTLTIFGISKPHLLSLVCLEVLSKLVGFFRGCALALRIGWRSEQGVIWHIFYLAEALVLSRLCRQRGVSHIHAHFGTNPASVAMLVNAISGIPYSFTVHGPDEFDRPEGIYLGEKIQRSKFAVAVSSFGRSQLMRWVDSSNWDKIKVVRCGVDPFFADAAVSHIPENGKLVAVARLAPQKGLSVLIESCSLLKRRGVDFHLVIVGDGEMRSDIEQQIERLGLTECIDLRGWRSAAEVQEGIKQSRALVMSSFAEGLPVVLMEAMALGRPVVATYIAGIPELVIPAENGWLVPAGDVGALANAMEEVLTVDVTRLEELGQHGRLCVLERHDVTKEARKLRRFFLNIDEDDK